MHAEALAYTRQTLGYQPPPFLKPTAFADVDQRACPGDVEIPGGKFTIGATKDFPFVFDNEKWAHEVELKPFRIARAPVTNGEYFAICRRRRLPREKILERRGLAMARIRRRATIGKILCQVF